MRVRVNLNGDESPFSPTFGAKRVAAQAGPRLGKSTERKLQDKIEEFLGTQGAIGMLSNPETASQQEKALRQRLEKAGHTATTTLGGVEHLKDLTSLMDELPCLLNREKLILQRRAKLWLESPDALPRVTGKYSIVCYLVDRANRLHGPKPSTGRRGSCLPSLLPECSNKGSSSEPSEGDGSFQDISGETSSDRGTLPPKVVFGVEEVEPKEVLPQENGPSFRQWIQGKTCGNLNRLKTAPKKILQKVTAASWDDAETEMELYRGFNKEFVELANALSIFKTVQIARLAANDFLRDPLLMMAVSATSGRAHVHECEGRAGAAEGKCKDGAQM
eukprot:5976673-Prymnesium_polylepis.1